MRNYRKMAGLFKEIPTSEKDGIKTEEMKGKERGGVE